MLISTSRTTPHALTPREKWLAIALLALTLVACLAPALPPDRWEILHYIDGRAWFGLPNGADVLSNLPFLLMGAWGLAVLRARWRRNASGFAGPAVPVGAFWFFAGMILTCFGSGFYHLHPDAVRLIDDRAGMTVAFAGVLGIAAGERISARAGRALVVLVLVAGLLAAWIAHGNLTPWAVVQFGGIALVLALACVQPQSDTLSIPLVGVIVFYGLSKLAEMNDELVFNLTQHLVSGHTLKHLLAALAAWPVIRALSVWR